MIPDDPFALSDDEGTVLRPNPGGRHRQPVMRPVNPESTAGPIFSEPSPKLGNLNPLEKAASGLLALITRLNSSRFHPDLNGLKNRIALDIEQFQDEAQKQHIDPQTIAYARYVLCTALDEAVVNTPWGNGSEWAQHSLLSLFHNEVAGGDRFFDLLKSLGQNPGKNRYLLELMYLCLALGFEGRYRLVDNGKNKLASIREWLFQLLQKDRTLTEPVLSPHWQGVTDRRNHLLKRIPLWLFGVVATVLLAAIYTGFLLSLNKSSDPVFSALLTIKPTTVEQVTPAPTPINIPSQATLTQLLAKQIELKQVSVQELAQRSSVILQSDDLFAPASSLVNPEIIYLLMQVADALNQLSGQVLVTGHSDNTPIRSLRFPSNWHLSKARATAVAAVLKQNLQRPERLLIEGRSDLEPIASNVTAEGRAKNRRVEITLLKEHQSPAIRATN